VGGAIGDDQDGQGKGAAWVLFLNDSPWTSLGSGLAGVAGIPHLAGTGSLLPASGGTLKT
jgi:hypothetical protein